MDGFCFPLVVFEIRVRADGQEDAVVVEWTRKYVHRHAEFTPNVDVIFISKKQYCFICQ